MIFYVFIHYFVIIELSDKKGCFMKWILSQFIFTLFLQANEAQAIIKKVEKNLRGDYMYSTMSMIVTSKRGKRTVKIESWSEGNDKSFIKILYPKKTKESHF